MKHPGDWKHVAAELQRVRDEIGWSQTTFAERSGVSGRNLDYLMEGERSNYDAGRTLAPIERILGWPEGTILSIARGGPTPPVSLNRDERLDDFEARLKALEADQRKQLEEQDAEIAEVRAAIKRLLADDENDAR